MTYFIAFLASMPAALWLLWIFYMAVMSLKRARVAGQLTLIAKAAGMPVLIMGYLLDAYVNLTLFTLLLNEAPQELTVTARLRRHYRKGSGWGYRVALWFKPLLDPHDPDPEGHIKL